MLRSDSIALAPFAVGLDNAVRNLRAFAGVDRGDSGTLSKNLIGFKRVVSLVV